MLCLKIEYEYNLDFIYVFCKDYDFINVLFKKIVWEFKDKFKEWLVIVLKFNVDVSLLWIGVYMYSGGSLFVLFVLYFIKLIDFLYKNLSCEIIFICGLGERKVIEEFFKEVFFVYFYDMSYSLVDLVKLCVNLFVYIGNVLGFLYVNVLFDN